MRLNRERWPSPHPRLVDQLNFVYTSAGHEGYLAKMFQVRSPLVEVIPFRESFLITHIK